MPDHPSPSSKTIRIDLLNKGAQESPSEPAHGAASLLRMNLSMRHRLPPSVARSRYQELLQSVYDAAIITTVTGSIIDANVRAVEFLQFEKSELCNLAIYELIAGADASLMDTLSDNLTRERFTVIQAYCIRRDGTTFPAEVAVNKLRLDELCLCFFIRDTTLRTQAEEMLRMEHNAIQNCGAGIVIADPEASIQLANPAFARMLGVERAEDLIGQDLRPWFADPLAGEELIRRAAESAMAQIGDLRLQSTLGREIFVQATAACTRDDDGEPVGLVFSFADITAHRQTEEALQTARSLLEQRVVERTRELEEANRRLDAELAESRRRHDTLVIKVAELEGARDMKLG
jgi:PAS domain S-box-containing protein